MKWLRGHTIINWDECKFLGRMIFSPPFYHFTTFFCKATTQNWFLRLLTLDNYTCPRITVFLQNCLIFLRQRLTNSKVCSNFLCKINFGLARVQYAYFIDLILQFYRHLTISKRFKIQRQQILKNIQTTKICTRHIYYQFCSLTLQQLEITQVLFVFKNLGVTINY